MSTLTREKIEALAPDQSSLSAALKLMKPTVWPLLAGDGDGAALWGECQGSGSSPYRVVVAADASGYKCTCPSRKFPCKHVLAVLWMRLDKPDRFATASPPQWVEDWSGRRRPASGRPPGKPKPQESESESETKPAPSLAATLAAEAVATGEAKSADPKAAARAEAQRQRLKAEREAAVLAGLDDLDRWVLDQATQGFAGFDKRCAGAVATLSKRLVDAKAGGLAGRLDRINAELFGAPEGERADIALERLAGSVLIAAAYRRQDRLPAALIEDVRRAVGWTVKREELLADAAAPRVAGSFIVAANIAEVQPDKLRRLETWLVAAEPKVEPKAAGANVPKAVAPNVEPKAAGANVPKAAAPDVVLLTDYVPVAGGYSFPFEPGESFDAEIVLYPSAAPLRGLMAARKPAGSAQSWPSGHVGLAAARAEYASRLAALPWLESWPLLATGLSLRPAGKSGLVLTDAAGDALAVDRAQYDRLLPMLGMEGISALFIYDGRSARLLAVDSAIGRWHEGD